MTRRQATSWILLLLAATAAPAVAADDSRVKAATRQVARGTQKIGEGRFSEGAHETARGVGNTIVEGGKFTGQKLRESSRAAEPEARSAWAAFKVAATDAGRGVRKFLVELFSN